MQVLTHRMASVEVDLNILKENYYRIEAFTQKEIFPVVKANAYGHGAVQVARLYERLGAKTIVVAVIDEAIELRKAGIQTDLLLIGYIDPKDVILALEYDVIISVGSLQWLQKVNQDSLPKPLRLHIKLNCGMNRRGFKKDEEVDEAMTLLKKNEAAYQIEGIFSHMPVSDTDTSVTKQAIELFQARVERLKYNFKYIHISNSYTTMNYDIDTSFCNAVRPGVVLYGYYSEDFPMALTPALKLLAVATEFQTLQPGDSLGYGYTFVAEREMKIGVVPLGYADGILRHFQNAEVYVENMGSSNIIGRICMDMLYVEVPLETTAPIEIELIGPNAPLRRLSQIQETIDYEIMCQLHPRIKRVYIGG